MALLEERRAVFRGIFVPLARHGCDIAGWAFLGHLSTKSNVPGEIALWNDGRKKCPPTKVQLDSYVSSTPPEKTRIKSARITAVQRGGVLGDWPNRLRNNPSLFIRPPEALLASASSDIHNLAASAGDDVCRRRSCPPPSTAAVVVTPTCPLHIADS